MDLGLGDKRVVVTGGSRGIGFACAKLFLAEGARVGIVSRLESNVEEALAALPGAIGMAADLCDAAAAGAVMAECEARLGPIDILVTSAGAARRTAFADLDAAAWRAAMEAKYFATIHAIDPCIKRMAARGSGVIITIIGNGGKVATPTHLAGGAANAALMLVTAGLGTAYAAQGVRVVGLNPGLTRTGRVAEGMLAEAKLRGIAPAEAEARSIADIPLGRMAEPDEVAQVAVFLASGKASYVTGVTISMDGAKVPVVV